MLITEDQIHEVVGRIVAGVDPDKVILFGSYAYGKPNRDSDLDLLIIKETDKPRYKRGREVRKHLRGMKIPLDIVVYTQEEIREFAEVETSFIAQVVKEGRVLYERCQSHPGG